MDLLDQVALRLMGGVNAVLRRLPSARHAGTVLLLLVTVFFAGGGLASADPSTSPTPSSPSAPSTSSSPDSGQSAYEKQQKECDSMKDPNKKSDGLWDTLKDGVDRATQIACTGLNKVVNPGEAVAEAGSNLADDAFGKLVKSAGEGGLALMQRSLVFWTQTSSINLSDAVIGKQQNLLMDAVAAIIFLGIVGSAITMMITRRPGPAVELGMGAARYLVVMMLGVTVITTMVMMADAMAQVITEKSIATFQDQMNKSLLGKFAEENKFLTFCIAVVLLVVSGLQWLASFARDSGLVVLVMLMPLAASGQFSEMTRQWLSRWSAPLLGLIWWKPMAAFIYSIGFDIVGSAGDDQFRMTFTGLMVLICSIVSLPALMGLFSFTASRINGGLGASAGGSMMPASGGYAMAGAAGGAMSSFMGSMGPGSGDGGSASSGSGASGGGVAAADVGGATSNGSGGSAPGGLAGSAGVQDASTSGGDSSSGGGGGKDAGSGSGAATVAGKSESGSGPAGGAVADGAKGAGMGAKIGGMAGPIGAGVGAVVGGVAGAGYGAAKGVVDQNTAAMNDISSAMGGYPANGDGPGAGGAPFPTATPSQVAPDQAPAPASPSSPSATPSPPPAAGAAGGGAASVAADVV